MTRIHLLVEDDYLEEFMTSLPKEKITVIEEDFKENISLLEEEFKKYKNSTGNYTSYSESMKNVMSWLEEREK